MERISLLCKKRLWVGIKDEILALEIGEYYDVIIHDPIPKYLIKRCKVLTSRTRLPVMFDYSLYDYFYTVSEVRKLKIENILK